MSDARTSPAPQARYAVSAVLELRGVSKVHGSGAAEVHALRQADLSVPAGSMVAVIGPSGSGKSGRTVGAEADSDDAGWHAPAGYGARPRRPRAPWAGSRPGAVGGRAGQALCGGA